MERTVLAALLLALWVAGSAAAPPQDVLTLDAVTALAVKNDPALLSAEQDIIIAKQRVSEARFLSLPQLELSGAMYKVDAEYPLVTGHELGDRYLTAGIAENFYSMRVHALQPLYTGGRNRNTLRMAKAAHSRAKVSYETVRTDVVLRAKKAFYTLLHYRALRGAALKWRGEAEALAAAAKKDAWEGLEARALLSGFRKRAERAAKDLEAARTELLRVLNREPNYSFDVEGDLPGAAGPADVQRSLVTAMETRSELKSEIYKAQLDELAVNMAMIRRSPNVYLGGSYDVTGYRASRTLGGPGRSTNWMGAVAIHFPLTYDVWTQIVQKKAQQRQGDLKRVELQDRIRFEIVSACKELDYRRSEYAARKEELAGAKTAYEEASRRGPPSPAALRAYAALCELEAGYLESVYDHALARIRLEWAQGGDLQE